MLKLVALLAKFALNLAMVCHSAFNVAEEIETVLMLSVTHSIDNNLHAMTRRSKTQQGSTLKKKYF